MKKAQIPKDKVIRLLNRLKRYEPEIDWESKENGAIEEGYKDEYCPKCHTPFLAFQHFVMCDDGKCPMKDGKPSILEQIFDKAKQSK
jgi:hypothetical protein